MVDLDYILDQKIGLGKSQLEQFMILAFVDFMDGFSFVFLSILLSILKQQWNLAQIDVIILGSISYLGMGSGLLFQGVFSDRWGRNVLISITMGFLVVTLAAHMLVQNYWQLLLFRFLCAFEFGISIPIAQVLLCESTPTYFRGRIVVILQLFFIFGILYLLIFAEFFLENFEEGNWRGLVAANLFPAALCFLGCVSCLTEAPRFNLVSGRLNQMGIANKQSEYTKFTAKEKNQLISWSKQINLLNRGERRIRDLFSEGRAVITITLWMMMIIWTFQSLGTLMMLPFLYTSSGHGFKSMMLAHGSEIFSIILAYFLIDEKKIGGRKGALYISITIYMIAQFSIFWLKQDFVLYGTILIRFADRFTWICMHQTKMECYTTYYRTFGLGISQFLGFIGAAISPFLLFPLFYADPYLPFLFISTLSIPLLLFAYLHPINATQEILDNQSKLENLK